jgi:hypothetical protein
MWGAVKAETQVIKYFLQHAIAKKQFPVRGMMLMMMF